MTKNYTMNTGIVAVLLALTILFPFKLVAKRGQHGRNTFYRETPRQQSNPANSAFPKGRLANRQRGVGLGADKLEQFSSNLGSGPGALGQVFRLKPVTTRRD
jgi:hypothetical protein